MPRARHQLGFTIAELLVALAAISLIAGFAVPAFFERGEVTLTNACNILVKDLRLAQNRAAFRRAEVRVELLHDGDGYRILDENGAEILHPYAFGNFERHYSADAVFEGVRIIDVDGAKDGAIVWKPDGTIRESAEIVIAFGTHSRIVRVLGGRSEIEVIGTTTR